MRKFLLTIQWFWGKLKDRLSSPRINTEPFSNQDYEDLAYMQLGCYQPKDKSIDTSNPPTDGSGVFHCVPVDPYTVHFQTLCFFDHEQTGVADFRELELCIEHQGFK